MRAPFQILAIPYRMNDNTPIYCVFHRADFDQWQFIAGGGEDDETPMQAAKREVFEEGGVAADNIIQLNSICSIPTDIYPEIYKYNWSKNTYVVPEYSFGFECKDEIKLSDEHSECVWLTYEEAKEKLKWDSNKTALYELNCRIMDK